MAEEEAISCSLSAAGTTSVSLPHATTRTGRMKTSMIDLVNAVVATMVAKIPDLVAAATVEEEEHLVA